MAVMVCESSGEGVMSGPEDDKGKARHDQQESRRVVACG